jgi:nicotinamidase/pyrazinamidase
VPSRRRWHQERDGPPLARWALRPAHNGAVDDPAVSFGPNVALVVVDLQNDFADPRGSLYVAGAEAVLEAVNPMVRHARRAGSPIFYTQDWHPPHTPHFAQDGGIWPVHCVAGSWGAQLVPSLPIEGPVVRKGTGGEDGYSGFSVRDVKTGAVTPTALDRLVAQAGIQTVVVCGLALDYCVKETALDAARLGYAVAVPLGATRAVERNPGDGARAIESLQAAGVSLQ